MSTPTFLYKDTGRRFQEAVRPSGFQGPFRFMPEKPKIDQAQRRRMRYAERKLCEAQQRLTRTERWIKYWPPVLADLKYERTCVVQPPLWPDEQAESAD